MSEKKDCEEWSDFGTICTQCGCLGSWIEEGEGRWRCKCCGLVQTFSFKNDYPSPTEEVDDRERDLPLAAPEFIDEDDLGDFELGND